MTDAMKEWDYYTVILNKSNIVPGTSNSVMRYDFNSSIRFENASMSLTSLNIYNSWFNVSSKLENNQFSYKWFDSSGDLSQTFNITIPDGYYSVNDLNEVTQKFLYSRGHYLKEVATGNIAYHIEFLTNATYYAVQMNVYSMMTALVAGSNYVRGTSDWAFPAETTCIQITIPSSNKFNQLIGITPGVYPSVVDGQTHEYLSDTTPTMDPVSSLMVQCSIISQGGFSNPDNILFSFTSGSASFGDMIDKEPSRENYIKIRDGVYQYFTIEFVDQEFRKVDIRDNSIVLMLTFKVPSLPKK